ncbi:MAG: hypothetical protein Q9227_007939 [Pyrenula ochraceoflavens]
MNLTGLQDKFSVPVVTSLLRKEIADKPPSTAGIDMMTRLSNLPTDSLTAGGADAAFQCAFATVPPAAHTTAFILDFVLYEVFKNQQVLQKMRNEIDHSKPKGLVSIEDARILPYTQAVIRETLRLHPAVNLALERVVPEGGAVIADRFFPPGTTIGVVPSVAGRNRSVYGDDAEAFRPERWLKGEDEVVEMHHYDFSFGAGSRICLGKGVAEMVLSKAVPVLVRDFDFDFCLKNGKIETINHWFVRGFGLWEPHTSPFHENSGNSSLAAKKPGRHGGKAYRQPQLDWRYPDTLSNAPVYQDFLAVWSIDDPLQAIGSSQPSTRYVQGVTSFTYGTLEPLAQK